MSSQIRKDPFIVKRDVVRDNQLITRKLRIPNGGQIRAQQIGIQAADGDTISMPFAGTFTFAFNGNAGAVIILNPFVKDVDTPVYLDAAPNPNDSILAFATPGEIIFNSFDGDDGDVTITVGSLSDTNVN